MFIIKDLKEIWRMVKKDWANSSRKEKKETIYGFIFIIFLAFIMYMALYIFH